MTCNPEAMRAAGAAIAAGPKLTNQQGTEVFRALAAVVWLVLAVMLEWSPN